MYVTDVNRDTMCLTKSGNRIHWLLTSEIGARNFELRYIEIPPGGQSSLGSHPHEHEVFVVKGEGVVKGPDGQTRLTPRMAVFVPGNEVHQWINTSKKEPFEFVCVVPKGAEAESKPPC
ncbi:MAG: cupin domain-containing protein [Sedimentisphaerales bacterium]|nr:cupin domain-containing protein [Sedimentisphaerales bacterium]